MSGASTEANTPGTDLGLTAEIAEALRDALPSIAERTVAAVIDQVPDYARPGNEMDANIEGAVQLALGAFLRRATLGDRGDRGDHGAPTATGLEAAYSLGRGEARSGRTMNALLSAYRAGARAAWRETSMVMVGGGAASATVAHFAELVFAYIDELSAASVAGHTDELATSGRVKQQYLERLGQALLAGDAPEDLVARAERAGWEAPDTLTVIVLPSAHLRAATSRLDPRSLVLSGDVAGTRPR